MKTEIFIQNGENVIPYKIFNKVIFISTINQSQNFFIIEVLERK